MKPAFTDPADAGQFVYVLWAEGTRRFKIGYTASSVTQRARILEGACPFPIRIIGSRAGSFEDEHALHRALRPYRVHQGEWFALPESLVWGLLAWLGQPVPADVTVQPLGVSA